MIGKQDDLRQTSNMGQNLMSGFMLVLSIVIVHSVYVLYVHPGAEAALASGGSAAARDFLVIIKDLEQEVCIIAMLWCCYLIFAKLVYSIKTF
jgi:hypothetical protein